MIYRLIIILCLSLPVLASAAPEASRTSGVAPLSVHFWADVAASTTSSAPFHELEYSWNFGDTNSGTWGTSGKSKNVDKGPAAAHVYETPGTYTATLTVKNPSSGATTSTSSFEITVTNPDTVFLGTKTTCISTTSDFTGCPVGAAQVTTSSLAGLSGYTDAGERVLLRRGSSWNVGTAINFPDNAGPVHIGAFGTCTSPDELGICSNAPSINLTAENFLNLSGKQSWTLSDISFIGSGSGNVVGGSTNMRNILMLRLKIDNFAAGVVLANWRNSDADYGIDSAVVSSRILNTSAGNAYVGGERLVFMGNIAHDVSGEHILRIWQAYQGVISHNMLAGAASTKQVLKLHGPGPYMYCSNYMDTDQASCTSSGGSWLTNPGSHSKVGTFAQTGSSGLRYPSQFVVIANNVLGGPGAWTTAIAPQNSGYNEHVSDIIFEKNKTLTQYHDDLTRIDRTSITLYMAGRYFTVRNNVFDATGGATDGANMINLTRGGGTIWHGMGHKIYNNTIINRTTMPFARSLRVNSDYTGDVVFRNNYIHFPNTSSPVIAWDEPGNATIDSNTMSNTPNFVNVTASDPLARDYRLTSSATSAIDQGYTVPVMDDYDGNYRTGLTYDVGAFEYGASGELGGSTITCYQDADNDLYGHGASETAESCSSGYYIASHFTGGSLTGDCNDNSASIYPGATEICGNSIDEDCSGADLACGGGGLTISTGSTMAIGAGTMAITPAQ
jgi:hypothetical protein